MFDGILDRLLFVIPWIFPAIAFHEFGHAWTADRLGDPTPSQDGRLTLAPWAHVDPMGLLGIIFAGFGWGKPVMIRGQYFRKPLRDMMYVALAGPFMNLLLAGAVSVIIRLNTAGIISLPPFAWRFLVQGVILNIGLMFFNLIPVPPLDGSKILFYFLRGGAAYQFAKLESIGPLLLLAVIFMAGRIISIPVSIVVRLLTGL
ncbi:MAG: site-2 protease family protein [Bacillota bacterium]